MKRNCCSQTILLLLCLFVFIFLGCSVPKIGEVKDLQNTEIMLQLAVKENDLSVFNQRINELGLVAVDFRPAVTNGKDNDNSEIWLTFRFARKNDFLLGYSQIMSTGVVHRIGYRY